MFKRLAVFVSAFAALAACASGPPKLEAQWVADGFSDPESLALSADGEFLYVSNVAGEGDVKNGEGFISTITLDGRLLERRWAEGLNAPKGLALSEDGLLWVTDIDRINAIDTATGRLRVSHLIGPAKFLNDIAIAPDGKVLAADSGGAKIYSFANGKHATWLADDQLDSVNGLLPLKKELIVTTMAGRLLSIDWETKAISTIGTGFGPLDGVTKRGDGEYFVSEWPGKIKHIAEDGTVSLIVDTEAAGQFQNDFLRIKRVMYVPSWKPGLVTAYRIK